MAEKHKYATLFLSSGKSFDSVRTALLHQLINKEGLSGVYITFNQSYKQLHTHFYKHSINPEQLFFVDAVTVAHKLEKKEGDCVYLEKMKHWKNLLKAVEQVIADEQYEFLLVDSLPLIETYSDHVQTKKLIKMLLKKNQQWQKNISFFCIPNRETARLVSFTKQHCEKTLVC